MGKTIITDSSEQTKELGEKFAEQLLRTKVLALHGDLGSGKTTFIQGLAKGLGINKKIISPTFIIMRTYNLTKPFTLNPSPFFYHIDLYRIKNIEDIQDLGLEDLLKQPGNLFAIEWAEIIIKILPKNTLHLYFEYIDENKRKININSV